MIVMVAWHHGLRIISILLLKGNFTETHRKTKKTEQMLSFTQICSAVKFGVPNQML